MNLNIPYTDNPHITFDGKNFCFAGMFMDHQRSELEQYVKSNGSIFTPNVSEKTDYLVLGSKRIRCCSFSCCVRVVEKAIELKSNGAKLQFIEEADFLKTMAV